MFDKLLPDKDLEDDSELEPAEKLTSEDGKIDIVEGDGSGPGRADERLAYTLEADEPGEYVGRNGKDVVGRTMVLEETVDGARDEGWALV